MSFAAGLPAGERQRERGGGRAGEYGETRMHGQKRITEVTKKNENGGKNRTITKLNGDK